MGNNYVKVKSDAAITPNDELCTSVEGNKKVKQSRVKVNNEISFQPHSGKLYPKNTNKTDVLSRTSSYISQRKKM